MKTNTEIQERRDLHATMADENPQIRTLLDDKFDIKNTSEAKDAFILFLESEVGRLLRLAVSNMMRVSELSSKLK